MTSRAERPRSGRAKLLAVGSLLLLGAMIVLLWLANPNSHTFGGFETHGGPIVVGRAERPRVLVLTSHWETRSVRTGRSATSANNYGDLHWDVFALDAKTMTPAWTTRVSTIRHAERNLEATIIGLSHNTLWIFADGLMALSLDSGTVLTDAEKIEQLNPQLRGMMPTARRQLYFDDGLILIAADGQRWRVDNTTFKVTLDNATVPVKSNVLGVVVSRATDSLNLLPLEQTRQSHWYKTRSFIVGDTWYGMLHPSEIEQQKRDPYTQNFSTGLRYRLWSSPLRDTLDRMRQPAKLPLDFAPLPESPEFLYGGLLSLLGPHNRNGVVGIRNPTRFIVLHQDRIDGAAQQTLSCIGLDGKVCWNASTGMNTITGFGMLSRGAPEDWALIVTGEEAPQSDKTAGDAGDNMPVIAHINVNDGKTTAFRFAAVDLAALRAQLKPYRERK